MRDQFHVHFVVPLKLELPHSELVRSLILNYLHPWHLDLRVRRELYYAYALWDASAVNLS